MKERSWLVSIGIMIYVILSVVDRFIYEIPDYIYIPIAVIGIIIIIIGFVKDKSKR